MSIAVIKKDYGIYTIGTDCAWFREHIDLLDTIHMPYAKLRKFESNDNVNLYIASVGKQRDMSILFDVVIPDKISKGELKIKNYSITDIYNLFMDYKLKAKEIFVKDGYDTDSTLYIIAFKDKAYVYEEGGIVQIDDYFAIGSGDSYALGALYNGATVTQAIYTACHFCSTCSVQNTVPIVMEVR